MKFSEYLLNRDEEMAFYVLEQSLQNESLLRGIKGIWNIARGRKYNQGDAKSAMNTANLIANLPDIGAAGSGIMNFIRTLGAGAAVSMSGGDANYKPPESVPMIKAYTPSAVRKDDDPASIDIFRSAKQGRLERFAKMKAFDVLNRKRKGTVDFIDQTPSI